MQRVFLGLILLAGLWGGGCSSLPALDSRTSSSALTYDEALATPLGKAVGPLLDAHPEVSGVFALQTAKDAFAARIVLASVAERTLDVQYYIWRNDLTGNLLFEALHHAAERGVRVRLLLDDLPTAGLDETLAALNAHPNLEVRLFNPFVFRNFRALDFILDFSRAHRRMHNKSFTADNMVTIVGGRNIGDEYFGATNDNLFADLDVLTVGYVVREVSANFDRYWDSRAAYPLEAIVAQADAAVVGMPELDPDKSAKVEYFLDAVRDSRFMSDLAAGNLALEWTNVRMVSDDPDKVLQKSAPEDLIIPQLRDVVGVPTREVDLISPYFVPTKTGVAAFAAMAEKGVQIKVLTNALEATDVFPAHAGYAKRRKDLLDSGIVLYEFKLSSTMQPYSGKAGPFGSSGASLHAKTFSVDASRVFVGSFNFDPRSAKLNTELGFVIDSTSLAEKISNAFETTIPANAYEVRLNDEGHLYWLELQEGKLIRHDVEPGTTTLQRSVIWILSRLPIEWLL
ncbi:phospholipase D family protein [Desulfonatronum thiosulfatophilum]|nr:phospholipase D family protein [Desulfonatronum thiosulfatophilum]